MPFQGLQHLGRAPHDPDGFSAPFDRARFTRAEVCNVHLDGRPQGAGALTGGQAGDKRHGHRQGCDATGCSRRLDEFAALDIFCVRVAW
ncbi:hypothetical protein D3C71_1687270 [compost metagenome]